MRRRRLLIAALLVLALVRVCGGGDREDDEVVDVVAHVKLMDRAGSGWTRLAAVAGVEPLFARPAVALALDRVTAAVRSGRDMPDLGRWRRVRLRGSRGQVDRALAALARRPEVVSAFVPPVAELATVARLGGDGESCPVRTPRYEVRQKYLGPAPAGIDAP